MGVLTFWLFAQTTLNIAPDMQKDLGLDTSLMNIAVAVTALFSGIFIVFIGGLADRIGRVRIVMIGFVLSIIGSLLIGFAPGGALAAYFLLPGRALQRLSGACIMPASLALVKTFWDGEARQRAVSMWSIGSWGGSGFCSLFGGLVAQNFGWRWIFFATVVVSLLGMALMKGTPESKAEGQTSSKFDLYGLFTFMVAMIGLQIVATQGNNLGWTSPWTLSLSAVALAFGWLFLRIESRNSNPFVDFKLFHNPTYTGATISNFLLNGAAGTLLVSLQLVQLGGNMTAQQAGMLTLGYAIAIVAFIRVGEKLLRRFGPRKPMIQGCLITGISIILLLPSNLMLAEYKLFAIVGYTLYGIGLAFYGNGDRFLGPAVLLQANRAIIEIDLEGIETGGSRRGDRRTARQSRRPVPTLPMPHHSQLHADLPQGAEPRKGDRRHQKNVDRAAELMVTNGGICRWATKHQSAPGRCRPIFRSTDRSSPRSCRLRIG
jgi:MFS transporter, DHA2 family, multidrug resistance protein